MQDAKQERLNFIGEQILKTEQMYAEKYDQPLTEELELKKQNMIEKWINLYQKVLQE